MSGPAPPSGARRSGRLIAVLLAVVVVGVVAAETAIWLVRPRGGAGETGTLGRRQLLVATVDEAGRFDHVVPLPFSPLSLTALRGGLLTASRDEPWGLALVQPTGYRQFALDRAPVIEPTYQQRLALRALAWNGQQVVGAIDGAWFQQPDHDLFVLLEPDRFTVTGTRQAPPHLGCLAWDGRGYWAGTRRDVADGEEPAFLYRLSADLGVEARYPPPAFGCQGLAWDGSHLWWADVFTDTVYRLEVTGPQPLVAGRERTGLDYLSGLAFLDGHLWIAEYDHDRLLRVDARQLEAWIARTEDALAPAAAPAPVAAPPALTPELPDPPQR